MPADLNGYWKMVSNDNFEEYMKALGEFVSDLGKKNHIILFRKMFLMILHEFYYYLDYGLIFFKQRWNIMFLPMCQT